MLIDSHCHITHLKERTPDQVIQEAKEKGVTQMLAICVERADVDGLERLVEAYPMIKATLGIHPCDVHTHTEADLAMMVSLLKRKRDMFIGVGETGLDFYYSKEHAMLQQNFFEKQILIANENNCPVIVHSRSAPQETVDVLKKTPAEKVIIHCFTESLSMAKACIDLGAYISFSGIITFKNAHELREVVEYVPLDRLLIETDCPYLAPVPHRGHENQPAYVYHVAEAVAQIKGIDFNKVAMQTTQNFKKLFSWPV